MNKKLIQNVSIISSEEEVVECSDCGNAIYPAISCNVPYGIVCPQCYSFFSNNVSELSNFQDL